MITYIQEKLHSDLSNRVLATVTHVAEDYVGQFFKMHTGQSLQNYIEYQRLEQAVKLLRTTQKSINAWGCCYPQPEERMDSSNMFFDHSLAPLESILS